MKILFDQGTPVPLRRFLQPGVVNTAAELGWSELENGKLPAAAEAAGFDLMITTDQNLRYPQNLTHRKLGIVVLTSTSWPRIQQRVSDVIVAINSLPAGACVEVKI